MLCPLCRCPHPRGDAEDLASVRRHVENDNPVAMSYLATYYAKGESGLVKSHKKAARLYQRAVELGDVNSMVKLGNIYGDGQGVKLDKKKMVKYYRMAADRGCAFALCNLGSCFCDGDGVVQDYVCLLYTSPSPRDQRGSRMPSSA